jgi:hypothetical protein
MSTRDLLVLAQAKKMAELALLLEEGNEYYAHMVRDEILVWKSPARLIHKAPKGA